MKWEGTFSKEGKPKLTIDITNDWKPALHQLTVKRTIRAMQKMGWRLEGELWVSSVSVST